MHERPVVSVGLPVYNGENYVGEAIESILAQSFEDFELIVSDNASTDRTPAIVGGYLSDRRVRYVRNDRNLGAPYNYARVFSLARGEYFKWAAHDDVCRPRFLEACLAAIRSDPGIVVAFTRAMTIDARGRLLKEWPQRPGLAAASAYRRFLATLEVGETIPVWGVMRRGVLARTGLLGNYLGHELPLLAELALAGKLYMVDEVLFLLREHPKRSARTFGVHKPRSATAWYDPGRSQRLHFPAWRLIGEYHRAVVRSPAAGACKLRCHARILAMAAARRSELADDLLAAMREAPLLGRAVARFAGALRSRRLRARLNRCRRRIRWTVGADGAFMLIDDGLLDRGWFRGSLMDLQGEAGNPANDEEAIARVRAGLERGATAVVVLWPAFWWSGYYEDFFGFLRSRATAQAHGRDLMIFKFERAAAQMVPADDAARRERDRSAAKAR